MKAETMTHLLEEFNKIPKSEDRRTFMEIAGYPHFENVCSNILAFFFSPDREHGLGSLLLESLLSAVRLDFKADDLQNAEVEREAVTDSNNRLDLLIQTDALVIGIENKIYHVVNNDLDAYRTYLSSKSSGRTMLPILLTLRPVDESSELHTFRPITYKKFFHRVLEKIGSRMLTANNCYLTYFVDFINTIQNLERGTQMNEKFIIFIRDHKDTVLSLSNELKKLRDEMRKKVKELGTLIKLDSANSSIKVKQDYYREGADFFDTLFHEIPISQLLVIGIDTIIDLSGWRIQLFPRTEENLLQLQQWLNKHNIPTHPDNQDKGRLVYGDSFAYEEDLSSIQRKLQELIDAILQAALRA